MTGQPVPPSGANASAANASGAGAPIPFRCIACFLPITGDGYLVPAVNPFVDKDGQVITYRAPYHAACLPAKYVELAALLGLQPVASA